MFRIHQLKLPIDHTEKDIAQRAAVFLGIPTSDIIRLDIFRRAIDARDKTDVHYVYTVDLELCCKPKRRFKDNELSVVEPQSYAVKHLEIRQKIRPVVIGLGPAGLFASYVLSLAGLSPVVYERGKNVEERQRDIETYLKGGRLDPDSNVLFGEGGAGAFSDGKLNTLIKDRDGKGRFVLETLVRFGADKDILIDAKPHVGTDKLVQILKNIRSEILRLGGEIHFNAKFTGFKANGSLSSVTIEKDGKEEYIKTRHCIIACGHSARDVFSLLEKSNLRLNPKAFAMGVRAIHRQELINKNQYGDFADKLPAASYKLTASLKNDRSAYSFCMCPGGYVINSASEEGGIVVNGMSNSGRDGDYANSAIIVNVTPQDFENEGFMGALSGVEFQRKYERLAYESGKGSIPVQSFELFASEKSIRKDFAELGKEAELPEMIMGRSRFADLNDCLPEFVSESLKEAFPIFDRRIKGFSSAILCGIESRTSSPVRIERSSDLYACTNNGSKIQGLYPCGEGAGYAGGIMSAALDGIKIAEQIIKNEA